MSIARNTLVSAVGPAVSMLVTLGTVPAYLHLIGQERYGILALVWTLLAYFGLVELGVSGALVQRIASGKISPEKKIDLFWTASAMNSAMGLIGGLILWLTFDLLVGTMSYSRTSLEQELRSCSFIIALILPILTIRSVFNSVLLGSERFISASVLQTCEAVLSALAPLIVAKWYSSNVFWSISAILFIRVFFAAASYFTMSNSLPGFCLRPIRRDLVFDLLSFGAWLTVSNVIGPLLWLFDRFLIGAILGVGKVPYYTVPQSLFQNLALVPRSLSTVLFPRFSALANRSQIIALGHESMLAMATIMTPVCVTSIIFIEPFFQLWISPDFAAHSTIIAQIVVVGAWINAQARIPSSVLYGLERPDQVAKAHTIELLPYAIMLFLFAKSFGIVGVSIAWTMRMFLDAFLISSFAGMANSLYRTSIGPIGVMMLSILMSNCFDLHSLTRWTLSAAILTAVSCVALLFMPKSLASLLGRFAALRLMPFGALAARGLWGWAK